MQTLRQDFDSWKFRVASERQSNKQIIPTHCRRMMKLSDHRGVGQAKRAISEMATLTRALRMSRTSVLEKEDTEGFQARESHCSDGVKKRAMFGKQGVPERNQNKENTLLNLSQCRSS
jgi:hypothetical protein